MKAVFLIIKSRFQHRKALNGLILLLISASVCILNIALSLCNGFEARLMNKILSFSPQISMVSVTNPNLSALKQYSSKIIKISQTQALAVNPENQSLQGIVLKGTGQEYLSKLLEPEYLFAGKYPENQEAIIGNKLAKNLGLKIGDSIQILADPASIITLKISGIFKVGLYDFDSAVTITPDLNIINLTTDSAFARMNLYYGIWLKDPFLSKKLLSTNPDINISDWQDDNKALLSAIEFEKKIMFMVLSLLVIIVCLAIAISQTIQILNNKNQIGILSAIGFTPKKILVLYLLEGFLLGIVGVLLGTIFTFIIILYLSWCPISLPIEIYHIDNLPVNINKIDILMFSFAAIIFSVISSLIPAIYASKLSPVEILRN